MEIWSVPVFKTGGGFDRQGDVVDLYAEILFNKTVCLVRDFSDNLGMAIGTAQLRKDGDTIYADLYIINDKDWHPKMTPAIGGKILKSIIDIKTANKIITEVEINVVSLNVGPNADPRIRPLEEL